MQIKELVAKIEDFKQKGCPLELDNTNVIAIRHTENGRETAEVLDFGYDGFIDHWIIKIKDWRKA